MKDNAGLVAPSDKYFYTVDRKILTNIHQLSEYIKKCSNEHFQYHVNPIKNDFYNWLVNVFGFSELAIKIKNNYDQKDVTDIIDRFIVDFEKTGNEGVPETQKEEDTVKKEVQKEPEKIVEKKEERKEPEKKESNIMDAESVSQPIVNDSKDGKFREFSDEELEKFTKFGVKDTETPVDEKIDYLKTELNELRNMIKDLRKNGKDMIIADLMLRVVDPKMAFYEYTKSHDDYEKIIQILNDARREIEYASGQTEVTIADEIIKSLELQRVMLRKDFTQKKQGVLGKIFKQSSQEVKKKR
jgi:hypothetical protein